MKGLIEILKKVKSLNDREKYHDVNAILTEEVLSNFNNAELYGEKSQACYRIGLFELSKDAAFVSISLDDKSIKGNHYLGNYYLDQNEIEKAKKCYNTIIKTNPNYLYSYNGLGVIHIKKEEYDLAIKEFEKILSIDPNFSNAYNGMGIAFGTGNMGNVEKAIENYNKAIEIDSCSAAYYNRALEFFNRQEYRKSLQDFSKYIKLKPGVKDYFSYNAKSKIIELRKLISSVEYSVISDLVNKIKQILHFKNGCITHYTSMSVAKSLIINDSPLRLSEGAFLNDTSEGRELYNFLSFHFVQPISDGTVAEKFNQKPFIGSFVEESKNNDLTLWRMYGKENKEEAKGCAITIDMNEFLVGIKDSLVSKKEKVNSNSNSGEDFDFYSVAYRKRNSQDEFLIPNGTHDQEVELNKLMKELKTKIKDFNSKKRKKSVDVQNIHGLLNEIAYLFKSDEYQFENEVRLVIRGVGFEKVVDNDYTPPKVYINLISIRSLITKITLGPKVDKADEWAASFFYHLDKDEFCPEILISHLPFK